MIAAARCLDFVVFWTSIQWPCIVGVRMARKLRIRVAFEPTRLGTEPLRHAYELIVPTHRRVVRVSETKCDRQETEGSASRREKVEVS